MMAPSDEHLVIFVMCSWQPALAATVAIAFTSVLHSSQEVLYPFSQILTEPALSTQIWTAVPLQEAKLAATQMSGPTSSSADSFRLNFFPSVCFTPQLIFRGQGT
jgi:hypothetical protein